MRTLTENKREPKASMIEEERYLDESKDPNQMSASAQEANLTPFYTKFDDKAQKQLLEDACAYVDNEIEALKKKIAQYDHDIVRLQQSLK